VLPAVDFELVAMKVECGRCPAHPPVPKEVALLGGVNFAWPVAECQPEEVAPIVVHPVVAAAAAAAAVVAEQPDASASAVVAESAIRGQPSGMGLHGQLVVPSFEAYHRGASVH